ncbi:MAG: hypothetical protein SO119_06785, partial [Phascolarctobacterium sp.]|nr:hypothetical protein [Phascolarctobacterium sp.]
KTLFFEEPIWLLLLKEINLTWSRVQRTLDPHIRFLIGSMFSFKGSNFVVVTILAFVLLPYRVDLYIIPLCPSNVNTFFAYFLGFCSKHTVQLLSKATIHLHLRHVKNLYKHIKKLIKK